MDNKTSSSKGFLDLPLEIRYDIYSRVLCTFYTRQHARYSTSLGRFGHYAWNLSLGLLRANKQISQEAFSVLYRENDFVIIHNFSPDTSSASMGDSGCPWPPRKLLNRVEDVQSWNMMVCIDTVAESNRLNQPEIVVMLADDLNEFCCAVCYESIGSRVTSKLKVSFEISDKIVYGQVLDRKVINAILAAKGLSPLYFPPHADVRDLLSPFKVWWGLRGVTFRGRIMREYPEGAKEIRSAMTHTEPNHGELFAALERDLDDHGNLLSDYTLHSHSHCRTIAKRLDTLWSFYSDDLLDEARLDLPLMVIKIFSRNALHHIQNRNFHLGYKNSEIACRLAAYCLKTESSALVFDLLRDNEGDDSDEDMLSEGEEFLTGISYAPRSNPASRGMKSLLSTTIEEYAHWDSQEEGPIPYIHPAEVARPWYYRYLITSMGYVTRDDTGPVTTGQCLEQAMDALDRCHEKLRNAVLEELKELEEFLKNREGFKPHGRTLDTNRLHYELDIQTSSDEWSAPGSDSDDGEPNDLEMDEDGSVPP